MRAAAAAIVALACCALAPSASGATTFTRMQGMDGPGPARYDRVGVLKVGPAKARNVLVLVPGTSASAAYFRPLAQHVVRRARGWQVWAVERRENLLEDHSVLDRAKAGDVSLQRMFDYYLGWLTDPSIADRFEPVADADVPFARGWGMRVAVGDLRRVVRSARRGGRRVVLGGHSLGATIATAYATWDFRGRPGARDLAGLVLLDGGSRPEPVTPEQARASLAELRGSSPWLDLVGNTLEWSAGVFNAMGSTLARRAPDEPSLLQGWGGLPTDLRSPVRVTNEAGYGYALDTETGPAGLQLVQVHAGRLAAAGEPRGWDRAGEITPIQRAAAMFSGSGLRGLDGTAWYHPRRLTIDGGAVAAGIRNPAQRVLGVRAIHGRRLGRLPIYAFGALGGKRIVDAGRQLARQSRIPRRMLTLVNRQRTYAHVDPLSAHPRNAFVDALVPFLRRKLR